MGLECACETQLIRRDETMIEDGKDVNDGRRDMRPCLSGLSVRGEEDAAPAADSLLVEVEEETEKCMHGLAIREQDLHLVFLPLLVSRTRDGRVKRSHPQSEGKEEQEDEDDEGIAGCSPAEPLVMQVRETTVVEPVSPVPVQRKKSS